MKVGITYDLREDYLAQGYTLEETAEFDGVETIAAIETALKQMGLATERIGNVSQLVNSLAAGKRWDLVFNIAEGLHGRGRETQVPALLEAYQIPCTFSDAVTLALTLDKALAKRVVRDQGVPTASFQVINSVDDLATCKLTYPLFAKPIAEGTGKGVNESSLITSPERLHSVCGELLQRFNQAVLVESFLPGREFTVGIIGRGAKARILGVMEITLNTSAEHAAYSFTNKKDYQNRVSYRLVSDAEAQAAAEVALAAWRALECRDAGRIDLRSDKNGNPHFLEVNPIAGLHPVDSDLVIMARFSGISYQALIQMIMKEVAERLNLKLSETAVA